MSKKYMIPPESSEEVIYQDEDGTWMVQPAHKDGWLLEPHALYPQPTATFKLQVDYTGFCTSDILTAEIRS